MLDKHLRATLLILKSLASKVTRKNTCLSQQTTFPLLAKVCKYFLKEKNSILGILMKCSYKLSKTMSSRTSSEICINTELQEAVLIIQNLTIQCAGCNVRCFSPCAIPRWQLGRTERREYPSQTGGWDFDGHLKKLTISIPLLILFFLPYFTFVQVYSTINLGPIIQNVCKY